MEPGDPNAQATFVGEIISEDQPQFNHEGGTIAFGPDGYLYISIGDGGNRDDEGLGHVSDWYEDNAGGNAQDIEQNLLGSILRIDVSTPGSYTVPSDNPFVGTDGLDEIYAYGFRNPYRFSFDMGGDRDLIVGDAGQDMWEEIDVVENGGNYGWNVMEGAHCFDAEAPTTIPEDCPRVDPATGIPLSLPVIEIPNYGNPTVGAEEGIVTIVGGNVYRGEAVPELAGRYIFGAFTTDELSAGPAGAIFVAQPSGVTWPVSALELEGALDGVIDHFVLGFGQDLSGEVYVLTTDSAGPLDESGKVFRLAPSSN